MKRVNILAAIFAFLLTIVGMPSLGFSQFKNEAKPVHFSNMLTNPLGFASFLGLDPNRFSMHQSYSLSYISTGGEGYSQGIYLNSMNYRLSNDMRVSMEWGISHQPLNSFGQQNFYQDGLFVSRADFEYKPSDNFSIGIIYNTLPRSRLNNPWSSVNRFINPFYAQK